MSIDFWIGVVFFLAVGLGFIYRTIRDWYKGINKESASFKQSLDLLGLPVITFYQGENKLNFLIDTGSTGCHVDSRYIPEDAKPISTTKVFGMEGNEVEAKTYVLAIYLNDKKYLVECIANDLSNAFDNIKKEHGVTLHGILGSNFFNTYNYIIDFDKYIFYANKK